MSAEHRQLESQAIHGSDQGHGQEWETILFLGGLKS